MTRFTVGAPPARAFRTALRVERWVRTWPEATAADLLDPGDDDGVGRRGRARFTAPLGLYRLDLLVRVTAADPPRSFTTVTRGDLEGTGDWTFAAAPDGATAVTFDWTTRLRRPWLRRVERLVRPVLVAAHHRAVRHGAEAYAAALDAPLRHCGSRLVR